MIGIEKQPKTNKNTEITRITSPLLYIFKYNLLCHAFIYHLYSWLAGWARILETVRIYVYDIIGEHIILSSIYTFVYRHAHAWLHGISSS